MKLLTKYITKEFLSPFIYSIGAFTILFIIVDLFDTLDETLKYNVPFITIGHYYLLMAPTILVNAVPLSVLLAVFYVIKNFNKYNEIIAMRMGGISLFKLLRPFLIIGLLISFTVLIINEFLVPRTIYSADTLRNIKMRSTDKEEKVKDKIIENLAFIGSDHRLYYIGMFNPPLNRIDNILIIEYDENKVLQKKIAASYALWEKDTWIFHNGIIYFYDSAEGPFRKTAFKEEQFSFTATPQELKQYKNQTDYMNTFELKKLINKFSPEDKKIRNRLLVDFYYKIAFSFISFMMLLFSMPLALLRSRAGALISIGASILIGITFYAILSICIAFGKGGLLPPLLSAWIANILFGTAGIVLTFILHK